MPRQLRLAAEYAKNWSRLMIDSSVRIIAVRLPSAACRRARRSPRMSRPGAMMLRKTSLPPARLALMRTRPLTTPHNESPGSPRMKMTAPSSYTRRRPSAAIRSSVFFGIPRKRLSRSIMVWR